MKRVDQLRKLGFDWAADLIETLQADKERLQEAAKGEGKAISKMLESRAKSARKEAERCKQVNTLHLAGKLEAIAEALEQCSKDIAKGVRR